MHPVLRIATTAALAAAMLPAGALAQSREQIRIVGSSTVYPFATTVAERFGRNSQFPTPVVESTGTGGGIKLFCAGVGPQTPDIVAASRPIQESEVEACRKAGVAAITEVPIGYDGIVLASDKGSEPLDITRKQLFQALAKQVPVEGELVANPHRTWQEIDPSLPATPIRVFGPPPTSGTRDAFVELVMEQACEEFPEIAGLPEEQKKQVCRQVREDEAFVEAGENDNLIVQKLQADPGARGIFGFSFLDQNEDVLQGAAIEGVEPTFENIADEKYPVSRPLLIYVKNAHADTIPGLKEYVAEFTSETAFGEDGYLSDKGLIPMPEERREEIRETATNLEPMATAAAQ